MYFVVQIINGLQLGAVYALIALGYTMVYGIIKLINFAHGEIMMVAAYALLFAVTDWGLPLPFALLWAMALCGLLGVVIERIAYRPLRQSSRLSALITAIGVSLLLQNLAMLLFKPDPRRFPDLQLGLPALQVGDLQLSAMTAVNVLLAILVMLALQAFIKHTRMGKAMIAVSEDMKAAQLMGINVNRTISMTFLIGSGLAALAALIYLSSYPLVQPYMGTMPGLKAFIAAVIGGIGLLPGAMLGGFVLGMVEALAKALIPSAYSQLSQAIVFAVLILVLLLKPAGLLGKPGKSKV